MPTKKVYLSNESMCSIEASFKDAVKENSINFNVETALIRAIIEKESFRYQFAYRVDYNALKKQSWYAKTLSTEEKLYKKYYASYGYMQILFGVAKHQGMSGPPELLFDTYTNIYHGIKLLKSLMRRYKNIKDVISAYNQGSNKKRDNGKYRNQKYVDKVYKFYKKFGGKR